ncbi:MAG: PP2C family protein-serine/threonine phosphatase [Acidobacteria bacterium]|nr:PP2C family protein-serine/threonine phosphatase [Acidobacteriota bacterium]
MGGIFLGAIFLFIGLVAWGLAALRQRGRARIFVLFGTWSAMYGAGILTGVPAVVALLPQRLQAAVPYLDTFISYLILVVGLLAFLELSLGGLRIFIQVMILVGLGIALAGICFFIFAGSNGKLIPYNNFLATCALLVLATVTAVPRLSRKFLVLPNRGVLEVGTLVFTAEALYVNVTRQLGYRTPQLFDYLGFAVLLLCFGYVVIKMALAKESQLLSIENELAIARDIQNSILPSGVPALHNLRITTAYHPMTAVAGDFYDFIPVDQNRAGFLVADVSGHGVPAALIAAMIKVAMQSVRSQANNPSEVLRGLNRALSGQLRGQFVSAAYLWMDTENHKALYSAAGHPPLLRWRDGVLERIESNGLLFGIRQDSDYPVRDLPLRSGDRFLLYTDGVTEPENTAGKSFGDSMLEQVVRNNRSHSPSELSGQLLSEIRRWQPASISQQDDITLLVIDVV